MRPTNRLAGSYLTRQHLHSFGSFNSLSLQTSIGDVASRSIMAMYVWTLSFDMAEAALEAGLHR